MKLEKITKKVSAALCPACKATLPKGIDAHYIKLSKKKGIKVYRYRFKSMEDKGFQYAYSKALFEVRMLKRARKVYKHIPWCYGLRVIRLQEEGFCIGIILQHLGNTPLDVILRTKESGYDFETGENVIDKIHQKLRKGQIYHFDLHQDNIMVHKGRFYVIDFACSAIETYA